MQTFGHILEQTVFFFDCWFVLSPHFILNKIWVHKDIHSKFYFCHGCTFNWFQNGTGNANDFLLWIIEFVRSTASSRISKGGAKLLLVGWFRVGHIRYIKSSLSLPAFYLPSLSCFLRMSFFPKWGAGEEEVLTEVGSSSASIWGYCYIPWSTQRWVG